MKKTLLLLLAFACATAGAQVYRRIGADGQVYFSDRPGPDAEAVDTHPVQTIAPPPLPARGDVPDQTDSEAAQDEADAVASYTEFTIVSPVEDEGVRANDGNVTIHLSLQPALMPGHSIVLTVDGEDGEQTRAGDGMRIELVNLSRGRHTVEAGVFDEGGNPLIRAGPVSFHVLRVAGGGG